MRNADTMRRFVFDRYPFRGQLVHLGPAWRAMLELHEYPDVVRDCLGEAVAATVLLASTLKFEGQLTLQLRGSGPMRLMLVECTDGLAVRAVARHGEVPASRDLRELSGDGTLTVTIGDEDLTHRYQGVVPLSGASMSECLQGYFESSEQLPTRLWLMADGAQASGLLLQRLPVSSRPASVTESGAGGISDEEIEDAWRRAQLVAGTVTGPELSQLGDRELLRRLFAEDDLRMFEPSPVFFRCRCTRERVEAMLRSLGRAEVDSILAEHGAVEVRCEFCSRTYRFDVVDAGTIFTPAPEGARGGVH